ncbi:MAG TPA: DUF4058 family protein [Caldilineaceae bacterium]|nr:DUF4058 family protein [Caldilineaceae bacterium]
MPTPFPGMDPYLERRGLWEEVHTHLIVGIQHFLTPLLRPKYRVAVEHRTYLALLPPAEQLIGLPDLLLTQGHGGSTVPRSLSAAVVAEPLVGELPMPEQVIERYLEVRDVATQEVITVIEILSRSNKLSKEGRAEYEDKRLKVLASRTGLVEIDLLPAGQPLELKLQAQNSEPHSDYRIVLSRSWQRPRADVYLFDLRNPIPAFPIPLRRGEVEPVLPLNQILHELSDQSGYDLAIEYRHPPEPPLPDEDVAWAAALVNEHP